MKVANSAIPTNIRDHPLVQLIKGTMERKGCNSIGSFARNAGMARSTVAKIISNRAPLRLRVGTLFKLEAALETPVGELLEFFRPTSDATPGRLRVIALEGLRGKYAEGPSLSAELHDERRAERQ